MLFFALVIALAALLFQVVLFGSLFHRPSMQRGLTYQTLTSQHLADGPLEPPSRYGFHSLSRDLSGNEIPLKIATSDQLQISAWHIRQNDDKIRSNNGPKIILNFHGNSSNRSRPQKVQIYRQLFKVFPGTEIVAIDYRGFADSPGKPTQEGVMLDARAAWNYAIKDCGVEPSRVMIVGQSLGAAVATHLAQEISSEGHTPWATLLICGFKSVPDVSVESPAMKMLFPLPTSLPNIRTILSRHIQDQWRSIDVVEDGIRGPLLWMHGTNDKIVPFHHGKSLVMTALKARGATPNDAQLVIAHEGYKARFWPERAVGFIKIHQGAHDDYGHRTELFVMMEVVLTSLRRHCTDFGAMINETLSSYKKSTE